MEIIKFRKFQTSKRDNSRGKVFFPIFSEKMRLPKVTCQKLSVRGGFSLIEMIVYISIMTLILVVVINMIIIIITSQKKVSSLSIVEHSAVVAFDRMSREIRDAVSIDYGKSQSSYPAKLVLDTVDEGGVPMEVEIYLENDSLKINDGNISGPLVDPGAKVTDFSFFLLSDGTVEAVKLELTLEAGENQFKKTETFYSTILLRHVE